jgi:hypothetical protein
MFQRQDTKLWAVAAGLSQKKTRKKLFLSLLSFIKKKTNEEATFSFAVLYTITSRTYLRLSSTLHQFKCSNNHVANSRCVLLSAGYIYCNKSDILVFIGALRLTILT